MLEELSADQWAEWVAFYMLEPWGFDVLDGFNALLTSTIARVGGGDINVNDFLIGNLLPSREVPEEEEPSEETLQDQVKLMFGHKDFRSPRKER